MQTSQDTPGSNSNTINHGDVSSAHQGKHRAGEAGQEWAPGCPGQAGMAEQVLAGCGNCWEGEHELGRSPRPTGVVTTGVAHPQRVWHPGGSASPSIQAGCLDWHPPSAPPGAHLPSLWAVRAHLTPTWGREEPLLESGKINCVVFSPSPHRSFLGLNTEQWTQKSHKVIPI